MSASYTSILWNKQKRKYDLGILIGVFIFILLFFGLTNMLRPEALFQTTFIRAFGWIALLLLHVILMTGPLSRVDHRFMIILYNRRHLGVTMFLMALIHGVFNIIWFHGFGDMNPVRSVFLSNLRYDSLIYFPFQVLGFVALVILTLMAVSSHDFWLKNLGSRMWKALHMMVYVAYGLLIMHVSLGALQNETSPYIFGIVVLGFVIISSLHIYAGFKEKKIDQPIGVAQSDEFIYACDLHGINNDRAKIVTVSGERVAIYKYEGQLSAVNNVCRHQGGPIGEGKVIDGCITCPWHGYQYRPEDGQSPPPFTEKIETYFLKLEKNKIYINPRANPPGTYVEPIIIGS